MTTELTTTRLRLRQWRDADRPAWAALNADPEVREFFDHPLTRAESDAVLDRFQSDLATRGWGWWALELAATGELIGMAGLDPTEDDIPVSGVEMGWRLARAHWGRGYATEAARAVLDFAFDTLALPEVLAIAAIGNTRSHAVMTRLGMTRLRTFTNPTEPPELAESVIYPSKPLDRTARTSPASSARLVAAHPPCVAAGLSCMAEPAAARRGGAPGRGAVTGCHGLSRAVTGCHGLSRAVTGCHGLSRAVTGRHGWEM